MLFYAMLYGPVLWIVVVFVALNLLGRNLETMLPIRRGLKEFFTFRGLKELFTFRGAFRKHVILFYVLLFYVIAFCVRFL